MKSANSSAGNLVETNDRSGLVERPLGAEHPLHQARLRAGEDVADVALMLNGGPQRMLDRSAVETRDGLKLVERDDHLPSARVGEAGWQREHFLREARDVAIGADARERHA